MSSEAVCLQSRDRRARPDAAGQPSGVRFQPGSREPGARRHGPDRLRRGNEQTHLARSCQGRGTGQARGRSLRPARAWPLGSTRARLSISRSRVGRHRLAAADHAAARRRVHGRAGGRTRGSDDVPGRGADPGTSAPGASPVAPAPSGRTLVVTDTHLDVLARLAEHQSNVRAAPTPHTCALVALPLPAIARALACDALAAWRAAAVQRSARMLGGGDGPLPVIDLDQDPRPLPILLRDLALEYGALKVWGDRDQPGFSREIRCRWRGGLQFLGEGVTVGLMDDPRPSLDFGHGVGRIYDGCPAPTGGQRVLVGIPPWADPDRTDGETYVVDPERRLGPYSGFLPPEAALGT